MKREIGASAIRYTITALVVSAIYMRNNVMVRTRQD